ncbi:nuclear transport factor 2 family protein [Flavobacterium chuncheonense]|uniref:Nuclear transport factor 2 family protein n=1 Tax=Flavobacterium chuncheonense TaxID=2026653 RepID=A0ABW5YJV3_9FLAO
MSYKKKIEHFYLSDGLRDTNQLQEILHDDVQLEWDSSEGKLNYSKADILNLAENLKQNFESSKVIISNLIEEENKVVLKYTHFVSTIENPKEEMPIAKMVVIWEFSGDKLYKGYQISQPA